MPDKIQIFLCNYKQKLVCNVSVVRNDHHCIDLTIVEKSMGTSYVMRKVDSICCFPKRVWTILLKWTHSFNELKTVGILVSFSQFCYQTLYLHTIIILVWYF